MVDGLNPAIERIRDYQIEVTWRDYVYSQFKGHAGAASERRRQLALDLWGHESVLISKVSDLTPRLAKMYAGKTYKTAARDIVELEAMELVERKARSIRPKISNLMSFLPARRRQHRTSQSGN